MTSKSFSGSTRLRFSSGLSFDGNIAGVSCNVPTRSRREVNPFVKGSNCLMDRILSVLGKFNSRFDWNKHPVSGRKSKSRLDFFSSCGYKKQRLGRALRDILCLDKPSWDDFKECFLFSKSISFKYGRAISFNGSFLPVNFRRPRRLFEAKREFPSTPDMGLGQSGAVKKRKANWLPRGPPTSGPFSAGYREELQQVTEMDHPFDILEKEKETSKNALINHLEGVVTPCNNCITYSGPVGPAELSRRSLVGSIEPGPCLHTGMRLCFCCSCKVRLLNLTKSKPFGFDILLEDIPPRGEDVVEVASFVSLRSHSAYDGASTSHVLRGIPADLPDSYTPEEYIFWDNNKIVMPILPDGIVSGDIPTLSAAPAGRKFKRTPKPNLFG